MRGIPSPRLFDKRIQLVSVSYQENEFGGASTTIVPGPEKWAYIRKTSNVSRTFFVDAYGIAYDQTILRITIRDTIINEQNLGVLYAGDYYRVLVAEPNDQYQVSLDLIAVKEKQPS